MRTVGKFDKYFLSIKSIGGYVDIHDFTYSNQISLAACRFNASKRNKGRKVSVHKMKEGQTIFYRVFLIEKIKGESK